MRGVPITSSSSTACGPLGFPQWASYTARADAETTEFRVTTRHPDGTTIDWKGNVRGETVDGTAVRKIKGTSGTASFKGVLRR